MRRFHNCFLIILLTATWPTAASAAPPLVGDMGTVDRIEITGTKFATQEQLRESLSGDLQFLLAAEPAAPLEPLLTTICRRIEAGYRRAGFADATIAARPDLAAHRIRVQVNEGPRYIAQGIRILGQSHVAPQDLARWLGTPHPVLRDDARIVWQPSEGLIVIDDVAEQPIWLPGKPARFNHWSREQLRRQVYVAFAEAGYFFPKLKVDIVALRNRGEAELVVEVEDEGPPGIIGSVEVLGAERHSPDAILRYLELAPGQPLKHSRLANLQIRLYESARFVFVAAVPVPSEDGDAAVNLRLKLIEVADGPLLGEQFSAEEQGLLRLRSWLVDQVHSGKEDLVLTLRDASLGVRTMQTVVSARGVFVRADVSDPSRALSKGVLFKLRSLTGTAPPKEETLHCLAGLEMTAGEITLYSPMRDRLFATSPGEKQLSLRLKLQPDPRQQRKLAVSIDPELSRIDPRQGAKPIAVDLDLAPAAFLILAHLPEAPCVVDHGVLRIKTKNALLEADATTGRLLKASVYDNKHEQEATLSAASRRLETSIADMRRIAEGDRNDRDPRRPMTSLSAFGICELAHLWRAWEGVALAADKQGFDVWQGLLGAYFLPDLDATTNTADTYLIPAEPLSPERAPRSENALAIAAETLGTCQEIFAADSWPCRLARAAVLYYANDDRGAQRELMRIDSNTTGPLGHLAAALVAGMIEPTLVHRFASGGLEKLTIADFRRDYSILLESRSPAVASAMQGLGRLSKLDPAHAQAAVSVLPKQLASFVGDMIERQRTLPDAPTDVVLAGLLDDYWTGGLEIQARFVLRWLADSSPPPATAKGKSKFKTR
ncbi:MAG TPA: hypothetical protein VHC22_02305 [Pirellulales bacterium]|nr:hypothetical protein [Pirellulales bacterium]